MSELWAEFLGSPAIIAVSIAYFLVVSVATLGVALAMAIKIYKDFNTLEEDKILQQMVEDSGVQKANSND